MNKEPKVSIIIPVYNGANYLASAIDSALNQTYQNCEVIVVNDGSSDGGATEKIALSYGEQIRYFKKENGGVATAVNYGIEKMTGEYFAWLSHDDYYLPDKIKIQMQAISDSGDEMSICHGDYQLLHVESDRMEMVSWNNMYSAEMMENGVFPVLFQCIHGSTILFHKRHFERVGGYDPKLITTQDSVFLFHLMRGRKTIYMNVPLMVSRDHLEQGRRTIGCHSEEWNQMLYDFCQWLSDEEKIELCGSVNNFYYRLRVLVEDKETTNWIAPYLEWNISNRNRFKDIKRTVSIMGAGQYGRRLLYDLRMHAIAVDYFLDNNPQKSGTCIDGVECINPENIPLENRADMEICMGILDESEARDKLEKMGYKKILPYRAVIKQLFFEDLCCLDRITICIYCAGEYGIDLYHLLRENGVHVNYFGDIDKTKNGYFIDGVTCISYDDMMLLDKKHCFIIVAKKNPDDLVNQFKENGFWYVTDYLKIKKILKTPVVERKAMNYFEGIKNQLQQGIYGKSVNQNIENDVTVQGMVKDYWERLHEDTAN